MSEKSDKIEQIMKTVAIWQPKAYFEHDGKKFFGHIIGCEEDALIVQKENSEFIKKITNMNIINKI